MEENTNPINNQEVQQPIPTQPPIPPTIDESPPPPPAPIPPVKLKKKYCLFLGFILVLILCIASYFVYSKGYVDKLITKPTPIPTVKPTPTATLDPTADWESVKYSLMKFSLKLPTNWFSHEEQLFSGGGGYQTWISYPVDNNSPQARLTDELTTNLAISMSDNFNLSLEDGASRDAVFSEYPKTNITVDKEKAIKLISPDNQAAVVYVKKGNSLYKFILGTTDPTTQVVFDQILTTFQFVDNQQTQYTCPPSDWVNCMPILTKEAEKLCTDEAITWYETNCPDFKGVAQ